MRLLADPTAKREERCAAAVQPPAGAHRRRSLTRMSLACDGCGTVSDSRNDRWRVFAARCALVVLVGATAALGAGSAYAAAVTERVTVSSAGVAANAGSWCCGGSIS